MNRFLLTVVACLACVASVESYADAVSAEQTSSQCESKVLWQPCYMFDSSCEMPLREVAEQGDTVWHSFNKSTVLNLGYTRDIVWVRVRVQSKYVDARTFFLELNSTRIEYVDWYVMEDEKVVKETALGSLVDRKDYRPDLRSPTISFNLEGQEQCEIFIRLRAETAIQLDLDLGEASAFIGRTNKAEVRNALMIGILLGLLLVAYLISWASKEYANFYYALGMTLFGMIFPIMGGYHVWMGVPDLPFWSLAAVLILTNISMLLLIMHGVHFLQVAEQMPRIYRWMKVFMGSVVVATVVALCLPYHLGVKITILTILITAVIMLGVSLLGVMRKQRDARFYMAGNGLFWIYMWAQMLFYLGILDIHLLPETAGMISMILSLILFFISMVKRLRIMQEETECAQARAVELQQQMNQDLELLVAKRTAELLRAKDDAERASQAKTEFFSQISHDLRSPLNWMVGLVESLWLESSELKLSDDFKAYLQYIKKGGYYLTQLLNNIMDVSAVESGHNKVRCESVDISQWSESLKAVASAVAKSSDVKLHWKLSGLEGGAQQFCTDPVKLSQVLMNLVHNAIKFTPPGKNTFVTIDLHEEALHLCIEDEGEGLPAQTQELFESYAQGENREKMIFDGVGLGLHIVKTNLAALGGEIHAANREGGGAVFDVEVLACNESQEKE